MTKQEIISALHDKHFEFVELLLSLNEKDFMLSANNKWTAGQHMKHIHLSISPLAKGLRLPVIFLKMFFGKANRPSKDYNALVKKYQDKLAAGGRAPKPFIPKPVMMAERDKQQRKLLSSVGRLCRNIESFTEPQLDAYILPHPLLGKVTVREMMYFSIYHVQHHQRLILQTTRKAS